MRNTNVFTEEGQTKLRNFQKRAAGYIAGMAMVGLTLAGGILWINVKYFSRPLERFYFKNYTVATLKSTFSSKSAGNYVMLLRDGNEVNPATGKAKMVRVTDDEADPVLNDSGKIMIDPKLGYMFRLKPGIEYKYFFWQKGRGNDLEMRNWMKTNIYGGNSFGGLLMGPGIIGFLAFIAGSIITIVRDRIANREYERGNAIRGTRLLQPKQYEHELEEATAGIGIEVFDRPQIQL